jgi:Erv1 / Alr family
MTGIDPRVWGPHAWDLVHTVAHAVRDRKDFNQAKHILYSFLYILPCDKCRKNYHQHIMNLPIPNDPTELPKWAYQIHNRISSTDYTWSAAKAQWSDHKLEWRNIMPFLLSVAATHPSARNIDNVYRDNLYNLMRGILHFMHIKDQRMQITQEDVTSRYMFKSWLKKVGVKVRKNIIACPLTGESCR